MTDPEKASDLIAVIREALNVRDSAVHALAALEADLAAYREEYGEPPTEAERQANRELLDRCMSMTDDELDAEAVARGDDPARVRKWASETGSLARLCAEQQARIRELESRLAPETAAELITDLNRVKVLSVELRGFVPVGSDRAYATIDGKFEFRMPNGRHCVFDGCLDESNCEGTLYVDGEDLSSLVLGDEMHGLDSVDETVDPGYVTLDSVLEHAVRILAPETAPGDELAEAIEAIRPRESALGVYVPRAQLEMVCDAASSWAALKWRPASEAPKGEPIMIAFANGLIASGVRERLFFEARSKTVAAYTCGEAHVSGWLPRSALPEPPD